MMPLFAIITETILLSLVTINYFIWLSPFWGFFFGGAYLLLNGYLLGRLIRNGLPVGYQLILGTFWELVALATIGGIVYKIANLRPIIIVIIITVSPIVLLFVHNRHKPFAPKSFSLRLPTLPSISQVSKRALVKYFLGTIAVILTTISFFILANAGTEEALRSPWHIITPQLFTIIFALNLIVFTLVFLPAKWQYRDLFIVVILTALTLSIGLLIYKIGYGFDPFVHQATESLIMKTGLVTPKPWYYLGQYGLVVILQALFQASIKTIDSLLLPLIAIFALPTLLLTTGQFLSDTKSATLATLTLIGLPLTIFIVTTPYGLATLFLLALILGAVIINKKKFYHSELLLWGLAFGVLVVHPLVGIPAFIFLTLRLTQYLKKESPFYLSLSAFILMLIIPVIFFVQDKLRSLDISKVRLPAIAPEITSQGFLYLTERYNLIPDAIYLFAFNLPLILSLLAVIGIYILLRRGQLNQNISYLITSLILVTDAIILKYAINFQFLIDYERGNFSERLYTLALLFLWPYIIITLTTFFKKLPRATVPVILFFLLTLSLLRTAGLYLTYPRFDTYQFDRGYSTSASDLKAVRYIENNSIKSYIVLANQAVSAAALQEIGFKQYFTRADKPTGEQIFFYPIPTGGTLYQYYLKMVYDKPTKETVRSAMSTVNVNEAYFVLNDYWFEFENIKKIAQKEADRWWMIDDGKIFIFQYLNN